MTTIIGAYPDVADAITTLTGGPTDRLVAVLPHAAGTKRTRTLLREARIECITTLAEADLAGAEWLAQELAASQGWHMDDGGPIIEALAEVRFVVEKVGMGLRFLDLSPRDRHRVAARIGSRENAQAPSK